ncbi:hypothetical protein GCM10027414_11310 [Humibacter ginsengiterrae]
MKTLQQFVYYAQWAVPALLVPWWIFAPGTGGGGWVSLAVMMCLPVVAFFYIAPIVTAVRADRTARRVPVPYAFVTLVFWLSMVALPMAMEGVGDSAWHDPSIFETWGMPSSYARPVVSALMIPAVVTWVLGIVLSFGGKSARFVADSSDGTVSRR